jgi:innexin, putative
MLDLFIGLKRVIKRRTCQIDNTAFRLHWLFTSVTLIGFSIILTARQYVGIPIDCMENNNLPDSMINTYCWIQSTFIISETQKKPDQAHYGVDNSVGSTSSLKYQSYYQWVCFILFFQGLFFYSPYYLWKFWEGGLIKAIAMGMRIALVTDEERGHKRRILLDYFHRHFGHHRFYAFKYFFCEFLCLVNVVAQFYFLDWFFDHEFFNYGPSVFTYSMDKNRTEISPMIKMFPRMTKCRFESYGSSGDINTYDILCMLPLNVVNEKIFIFVWFWLTTLFILFIFVIVYRIFIFAAFRLRPYFLKSRCTLSNTSSLRLICEKGNIGDWFVLYMLANNLDPIIIREITDEICERLSKDHPTSNTGQKS